MSDSQQLHAHSQLETPPQAPLPVTVTGNGLGLAALIIGILAFIGAFIPFVNFASGLLALVGLVLGVIALLRKGRPRRAAAFGTGISAMALVLSIVMVVVYTAGFVAAVDSSLPQTAAKDVAVEDGDADAEPAVEEAAIEEAAEAVGTRDNPAPLGTTIETTTAGAVQYEVTLGTTTLNANELVAATNQFNEAAPEGFQFAMVPVTVVYKGSETGTPWIDLTIEFVSAAGTTHTSSDVFAAGPSPSLTDVNELYTDASGTGNVVIAIPSADAESGTWAVSSLFGSDKYYYAAQ